MEEWEVYKKLVKTRGTVHLLANSIDNLHGCLDNHARHGILLEMSSMIKKSIKDVKEALFTLTDDFSYMLSNQKQETQIPDSDFCIQFADWLQSNYPYSRYDESNNNFRSCDPTSNHWFSPRRLFEMFSEEYKEKKL